MADSFADLWNSSAPVKPSEPPRKLGASHAPSSGMPRPKYDAFAMLAASSSNSSSPRSLTPSNPGGLPQKSNGGAVAATSGDAFGDLLSGSFTTSSSAKLTMAEKAAKVKPQVPQQPAVAVPLHSTTAWAGLDTLAGVASLSSAQASKSTSSGIDDDDWLFGSSTNSAQAESTSSSKPQTDDWGLGDFASLPKPSSEAPPEPDFKGKSPWDLDDLISSPERDLGATSSAQNQPPSRTHTPGDFDFGDRENGLLDDDSGSEDDVLGDLSRPVYERPAGRPFPSDVLPADRKSSPPPHLIGQIVEMGFSPNQARAALAGTESGLDVQAALETLLSDASGSSSTPAEPMASGGSRRARDRLRDNDGWGDEQHDPRSSRPRPRHQSNPSQEELPSTSETNYQQQADKIITHASEIGSQLFQRANAFWKEGKSRVQKAYEERAASSRPAGTGPNGGQDGKPKWMQEDLDQSQPTQRKQRAQSSFRDEADIPSTPPEPPTRIKSRPQAKPSPPSQTKATDLFGEDMPTAYVSPFRRGTGSHAAPPSSVPAQTGPLRAPSPIRLSERQVVSAPPSAISASAQHKASGTEMFKLGRFAEAEVAYTSAISQLPDSHLLLVPLLNNRGLSRLKTGNMTGAIEDCTAVIAIVGPSYHPARETKVAREEDGASVDLGDGLLKAWRRRAEAYEGKEKWELARQDWESIAGADFAGRHRSEALSGIGRCRKMLNVDNASDGAAPSVSRASAPTRPKPRPPHPPPRRGPTPPSEALTRLKQANQEAEAEENARLELKDSVDTRLATWKNGKETNLRALVASLDTVLWPELGWQKVGMAELVTPNQVKIRYTKAIAKLHPDKLNVKNTTLEQRMIANGVFGTLNDAWNAFKP